MVWGFLTSIFLTACQPAADQAGPAPAVQIGFFNPSRVEPQLVQKTQFGMVNAISPEQIASSMRTAQGTSYKVMLDLSSVVLELRDKRLLSATYGDTQGQRHTKNMKPGSFYKVFQFKDPADMSAALAPY